VQKLSARDALIFLLVIYLIMFCFVAAYKDTGKYLYLELLEVKSYETYLLIIVSLVCFSVKYLIILVCHTIYLYKFFSTLSDEWSNFSNWNDRYLNHEFEIINVIFWDEECFLLSSVRFPVYRCRSSVSCFMILRQGR